MPNDWFRFKEFTVQQKHAAMKVGTDGVLLGAWATAPRPGSRILDVGTGTGLIALMMAQRTSKVKIDALEIDPSSAQQALENFQSSPWKESLFCIHSSFQDYSFQNKRQYDQIICNPPYFSGSLKTRSKEKNLARHDDSLSLEEFFKASVPLLKKTGIISLILPVDKESQGLKLGKEHQVYNNRLTRVIPKPGNTARRVLLEFSFSPESFRKKELTIETRTRHIYTDNFKSLVEKFYL